jgi:radical SAM superfamily enzyme YgiQ (UPF0313 family)
MRILLINPPNDNAVSEYAGSGEQSETVIVETEDFGQFPPLGLLYVLASLRKKLPDCELYFLDCVASRINHVDLAHKIAAIRPELVGITSFTLSLYDVCLAARTVRRIVPSAHICMGGHHPIAFPFEAAALPEFDSIIVGEGEEAFPALANALINSADYTCITGLFTRETITRCARTGKGDARLLSNLTVTPAYVDNLDLLPLPDRSFIRDTSYRSIVGASNRMTTMVSSRGCPYGCTYCDVPYKRYRQRSIISVADEIRDCLDMGYEEVHFFDDLFNIQPERVIGFCDEIMRRGYRIIWDFRGRVNTVNRESLVQAKRAGCRMISFGVETGSDEGLRQLKKNTTTAQVNQVFRWCRELGILTIADFMIGLPFERSEVDVRRNVDFLLKLDPDYAQFSVLSLFPHTEVFEEAAQLGLIDPVRWQSFSANPGPKFFVDHWHQYLDHDQLLRLQKESYRRFYLRPRYIWRSMIATCSWHEFTSKLRGAMKLLVG